MGHWLSVPFLTIFLGGFAYVALKSVSFWIQQARGAELLRVRWGEP